MKITPKPGSDTRSSRTYAAPFGVQAAMLSFILHRRLAAAETERMLNLCSWHGSCCTSVTWQSVQVTKQRTETETVYLSRYNGTDLELFSLSCHSYSSDLRFFSVFTCMSSLCVQLTHGRSWRSSPVAFLFSSCAPSTLAKQILF